MSRNVDDVGRRTGGVSLTKGPVGLLGLFGVLFGIGALVLGSHGFALHFPGGAAHGSRWLGVAVNGWTGLLFIAAGLLLLLSSPLHWGAKGMSLLVGVVFVALAVIAVIRGDGVFGVLAANQATELIWGVGGALLCALSLLPRVGGRRRRDPGRDESVRSRDTDHAPGRGRRIRDGAGGRRPARWSRTEDEDPRAVDGARAIADNQR